MKKHLLKTVSLIIALILLLSLFACSGEKKEKGKQDAQTTEAPDQTPEATADPTLTPMPESTPAPTQEPTPEPFVTGRQENPSVVTDGGTTFAIKSDGTLWAWGRNSSGQVGCGTTEDVFTPVRILDNVSRVWICPADEVWASDEVWAFALKADGSLWGWGCNKDGRLGLSGAEIIMMPTHIMDNVRSLEVCGSECYVLTNDDKLYSWGDNETPWGGHAGEHTSPVHINEDVREMVTGYSYGFNGLIKNDGSLWLWGAGVNADGSFANSYLKRETPVRIFDNVMKASLAACGFALLDDGSLYALRAGYLDAPDNKPVRMMENAVDAFAFGKPGNVYAILEDGSLWGFGMNNNRLLGCLNGGSAAEPVRIANSCRMLMSDCYTDEDYGYAYSFLITDDNTLYSWGIGFFGSLGKGGPNESTEAEYCAPITPIAEDVADVVSDGWSTFILRTDGTVWACGYNGSFGYGITEGARLGDGTAQAQYEFVKIAENAKAIFHNIYVVYVPYEYDDDGEILQYDSFLDYSRTYVLLADGTLLGFGCNVDGALGCGGTETALMPIEILDGVRVD